MNSIVENKDSIIINKKRIPIKHADINHTLLSYDVHNPRVYSNWNAREHESLDQKTIEEKMQQLEHVKVLKNSIEENGGVIEPLYVQEKSYIVFEGNSRLAAFRILSKKDPVKWVTIKCVLLPSNLTRSEIDDILGTLHIVGRKDWDPFEQAGHLYRRSVKENIQPEELAKKLGIKKTDVKDMIKTYEYMMENGDAESSRYSYYFELLKNRGFKELCNLNPKLEVKVVEHIKGEKINRAEQIREFTLINRLKQKQKTKIVESFIDGDKSFNEMIDDAKELGADNTILQKFEKFRTVSNEVDQIRKEYEKMPQDQKRNFKYITERIVKNLNKILKYENTIS